MNPSNSVRQRLHLVIHPAENAFCSVPTFAFSCRGWAYPLPHLSKGKNKSRAITHNSFVFAGRRTLSSYSLLPIIVWRISSKGLVRMAINTRAIGTTNATIAKRTGVCVNTSDDDQVRSARTAAQTTDAMTQ